MSIIDSVTDKVAGGGRLLLEGQGFDKLAKQFEKGGVVNPQQAATNYMDNVVREHVPNIDQLSPYQAHLAIRAEVIKGTVSPGKEAKEMQENGAGAIKDSFSEGAPAT